MLRGRSGSRRSTASIVRTEYQRLFGKRGPTTPETADLQTQTRYFTVTQEVIAARLAWLDDQKSEATAPGSQVLDEQGLRRETQE